MLANNTHWKFLFLLLFHFKLQATQYENIIGKLVTKYSNEYLQPIGYHCKAYGGGMHGDVRQVFVSYVQQSEISIEQARSIYVDAIEELLKRINSSRSVRPYLHCYPFQRKNLSLTFSWRNDKNEFLEDDKITFILLSGRDELCYFSYSPDKGQLYAIYSEPYEEALAIVRKEREAALGLPESVNQ